MTRFPYSYQMQQLFQIVSITITIGSYDLATDVFLAFDKRNKRVILELH